MVASNVYTKMSLVLNSQCSYKQSWFNLSPQQTSHIHNNNNNRLAELLVDSKKGIETEGEDTEEEEWVDPLFVPVRLILMT